MKNSHSGQASPLKLSRDNAYRITYKIRGVPHVVEGQYRGHKPMFTCPGQGIHLEALHNDGPLGWIIPEPIVESCEELWAEVEYSNGHKHLRQK